MQQSIATKRKKKKEENTNRFEAESPPSLQADAQIPLYPAN